MTNLTVTSDHDTYIACRLHEPGSSCTARTSSAVQLVHHAAVLIGAGTLLL